MTLRRNDAIIEAGITELVGKDEVLATTNFSASVAIELNNIQKGGVIHSVALIQVESGSGALLSPAGEILFLTADPATAANATDLTAAEWKTVFGKITVTSTDWVSETAGGVAYYKNVDIPFPNLDNIYVVFHLTSATGFNDVGGDDEELHINFWYENHDLRG